MAIFNSYVKLPEGNQYLKRILSFYRFWGVAINQPVNIHEPTMWVCLKMGIKPLKLWFNWSKYSKWGELWFTWFTIKFWGILSSYIPIWRNNRHHPEQWQTNPFGLSLLCWTVVKGRCMGVIFWPWMEKFRLYSLEIYGMILSFLGNIYYTVLCGKPSFWRGSHCHKQNPFTDCYRY
jgi:hypothetical protein